MKKQFTFVDLFSGAGGFSLGFEKAGFKNIFSLDMEPNFCLTYKRNFPTHTLIQEDIKKLTEKEIKKIIKNRHIDVIIGGPPCQGFSIAGNVGRKFVNDPRNKLFNEFARLVKIIKPDYFVMENVARLFIHNKGKTREEIISTFRKVGYNVECQILNAADFGVPQIRRRVVFIGTKKSQSILFPMKKFSKYITVKEAIKEFENLVADKNSPISNHVSMNHSAQMVKKMSYVSETGSRLDIPKSIRPRSGDVRKYIRYNSIQPSVCITGDMRKVFHYLHNRALTVRELAKLQSYPNSFVFEGPSISQQQQVGNSVPPLMALEIAHSIKKMATHVQS